MSLYFQTNSDASQQRALNAQWTDVVNQRADAEMGRHGVMSDLLRRTVGLKTNGYVEHLYNGQIIRTPENLAVNQGLTPADSYQEFDKISEIIRNPVGEFATLGKVLGFSRSVNLGREVFKYRKVSADDQKSKVSMSGQTGVTMNHTTVSYAGTIIPITDKGYGRNFRQIEAMRADGYDALVDDAREADLAIRRGLVDSLWNGFVDANGQPLVVDGQSWRGIKADPTVSQQTFTLDILDPATTPIQVYNLFKGFRDTMRITNNMAMEMEVAVSREMYSVFEQPFTEYTNGYGKLLDMLKSLAGIKDIYEDPALSGNELSFIHFGFEGLSAVTGMAMSTIAVPRNLYNDDYNFIKACATGFLARTDYADHKSVLYAVKA